MQATVLRTRLICSLWCSLCRAFLLLDLLWLQGEYSPAVQLPQLHLPQKVPCTADVSICAHVFPVCCIYGHARPFSLVQGKAFLLHLCSQACPSMKHSALCQEPRRRQHRLPLPLMGHASQEIPLFPFPCLCHEKKTAESAPQPAGVKCCHSRAILTRDTLMKGKLGDCTSDSGVVWGPASVQ